MPTTIAIGDRDVGDFAQIARRLHAELPQATLHSIPDAGHLLALDQPAAVGQLVVRHVESLAGWPAPDQTPAVAGAR